MYIINVYNRWCYVIRQGRLLFYGRKSFQKNLIRMEGNDEPWMATFNKGSRQLVGFLFKHAGFTSPWQNLGQWQDASNEVMSFC